MRITERKHRVQFEVVQRLANGHLTLFDRRPLSLRAARRRRRQWNATARGPRSLQNFGGARLGRSYYWSGVRVLGGKFGYPVIVVRSAEERKTTKMGDDNGCIATGRRASFENNVGGARPRLRYYDNYYYVVVGARAARRLAATYIRRPKVVVGIFKTAVVPRSNNKTRIARAPYTRKYINRFQVRSDNKRARAPVG